ncbi:MAG: hypothetical protein JWM09_767 [Francisellaceae bacterium]|nr:hypothetical protein [Francisellaceae bacterium]
MRTDYKGTDKEGRIRLGNHYANKQWKVTELDNGSLVLVPMVPVTDEEAITAFNIALHSHRKTIDALQ